MDIIEENKLISDYLGKSGYTNYLSSWNKLMPVIEKISRDKFEDDPDGDGCYPRTFGMINLETDNPMFRFNRYPVFEADTLIEAAFNAVVDYLKFNNK